MQRRVSSSRILQHQALLARQGKDEETAAEKRRSVGGAALNKNLLDPAGPQSTAPTRKTITALGQERAQNHVLASTTHTSKLRTATGQKPRRTAVRRAVVELNDSFGEQDLASEYTNDKDSQAASL